MLVQFNQKENSSPFDSIKRFDAEGNEYWTARDLMGLLGYRDYKRMEDAIQRAIASCQNTGNPCSEHFRAAVVEKINKIGRPRKDYYLSRTGLEFLLRNVDNRKLQPHNSKPESYYRDLLCSQLNGQKEVITAGGAIDVITRFEVIEVKCVKKWKAAIGQVLVYGAYYPSHQKRIHLIGYVHSSMLQIIQSHCERLDIKVTWAKL